MIAERNFFVKRFRGIFKKNSPLPGVDIVFLVAAGVNGFF
jgi:hypothetical protein